MLAQGKALFCVTIGPSPPEVRIELQPAVIDKTANEIITAARCAVIGARIVHLANPSTVFWSGDIILELRFDSRFFDGERASNPAVRSLGTLIDHRIVVKNRDG